MAKNTVKNSVTNSTKIEIYTKSWCPYCHSAKALLDKQGLNYVEYDVTNDTNQEAEMRQRAHRTSVPQIFVDGDHLGGFDDLAAANRTGQITKPETGADNAPR
jgi:GrxC family glutaredoxin